MKVTPIPGSIVRTRSVQEATLAEEEAPAARPRLSLEALAMTGKAVTAVNVFAIGGTFVLQWWMGLVIGLFPTDAAGAYPPVAYSVALLLTATGALLALIWYQPLGKTDVAPESAH